MSYKDYNMRFKPNTKRMIMKSKLNAAGCGSWSKYQYLGLKRTELLSILCLLSVQIKTSAGGGNCNGVYYNYSTQVCCDGVVYTGTTCPPAGGGSNGGTLTYVCHPNGTVEVTNPNPGTFTDVMAVQNEGLPAATKCSVSTTGSISLITGCAQDSAITVFFSDRTFGSNDLFGGHVTQSFDIQCNDIADTGITRTVSNLLGATLEFTTQDAVSPSFTISSALRSGSQTGSEVSSAVIADTLYWTIDIPSDYSGMPTCTAYSGSSSSGSPSQELISLGCNVYPDIVADNFDNIDTSVPLIKRLWTTLYVFKFYNSDDIYIECSVKVCPSGSSSCDLSCGGKKRSVAQAHNPLDTTFTTGRLLHISSATSAGPLLHISSATSAGPILNGSMTMNAVILLTLILLS